MYISKVASLAPEDLTRWRMVSAEKELVEIAHPGMSVDESRRAVLQYYKVLGDLMSEYKIDSSDDTIYISPVDGGIYTLTHAEHE